MNNENGHEMITQIDQRQAKIAKLYVVLINTGELLKSEIKYPTRSPEELQNLIERYCAVSDGILSKNETIEKIRSAALRQSSI